MRGLFTCGTAVVLIGGMSLGLGGCGRTPAEDAHAGPTPVTVSYPVEREITDYAEYTGRTKAIHSVEVRARVWGFLDKVNFKEGALVKKNDVLFEIDPRTYKASLSQAEGNLAAGLAKLKRLNADLARAEVLLRSRGMSREDYDKVAGDRGEAAASLDLGFTKVIAPISGRVSRALVTEGNLIASSPTGGTVVTNIVSVDPIYAYFDVDERSVQHVRRLIREGKAKSARDVPIPLWLALATDEGFPHEGTIDFVDNQVNPKTGTLRIRGIFPNHNEVLSPGYFVRVRFPVGFPHSALLVTDRAIDTDQGQKIVYVVGPDQKVATRPVRLGVNHDGLRVITEGLRKDDRVIVTGVQQVRPGTLVDPKRVDMPTSRKLGSVLQ